MQPIMIARVTHILSYTEVLRTIGTPLGHELSRVKLPALLDHQPDAYVPVVPVLKFFQRMEHREGIDDLGFLASQQTSFGRLSGAFVEMCQSIPSLYSRFQLFSQLAPLENSSCRVSLIREEDNYRVCNNLIGHPELEGLHYSEWLQIGVLIDIVQKTLGPKWSPSEITFQTRFSPSDSAFEKFPNTRFLFGQKNTSITVPALLMSQSLSDEQKNQKQYFEKLSMLKYPSGTKQDFPGSLKLALRSYFHENYPDINLAAEIADTSVRTLQRRLEKYGLNYTSLVQQARFEVAADMLSDPNQNILDITHATGFSDPSHFARSFRKVAGVSPSAYRRQHYKN